MSEYVLSGSNKCCECGEMIDWKLKKSPNNFSEEVGMVTYSILKSCPNCRIRHYISIDIDDSVSIKSTGEKASKRDKKTYVMVCRYKSKTKEELYDKVKNIIIKYINQ